MKIVKYNSIIEARQAFQRLPVGDWHSFQTYEVYKGIDTGLNCITRVIRRNGPIRVFVVMKDDLPILIAPLRKKWSGVWVVAGSTEGYDYVDFLYGGASEEDYSIAFDELMIHLKEKENVGLIQWDYLDTRSRSMNFLEKYDLTKKTVVKNVEIKIDYASHEDYLMSLSQNTRQNTRKAYSRLRKDGHEFVFKMYSGCGIGDRFGNARSLEDLQLCTDVYCKRQKEEYRELGWGMEKYVRHCHYMAASVNSPEHYFCALFIDGQVAGYMQGYINPRRRAMEIPRFAINSDWGWYSPGKVLISECVRFLMNEGGGMVKWLDIGRGEERYKYDMGGVGYETLNFILDL